MTNSIRVLLVDDHPVVRSGIRMLLERADDIQIIGEADRGQQGLDLIASLQPDVVLLDMEMPDMTGVDVMRTLQSQESTVRVLGMSAYDDPEYIRSLLGAGAYGYLTKDEALDSIVEAVRGVAQGQEGWLSRRAAARLSALTRQPSADPVQLTEREEEVLRALARGWSNDQIADHLVITERTVRYHLTNIYQKLNLSSRAETIAWAHKKWDALGDSPS
mgnify:CR=1 FL=1